METKQLWVARYKDNRLFLYSGKPKLEELVTWDSDQEKCIKIPWFEGDKVAKLDPTLPLFEEITFENSPRKVSITIDLT